MEYSPIRLCLTTLMVAVTIAACCSTTQTQPTGEESRQTTSLLSGWATIEFGINQDYISTHRGQLEEIYDEFVGRLFDDGLKLKDTGWLKPTYGNRNLLWTLDPDFGYHRQKSLLKSKEEFQSDTYEFRDGSIDVAGISWNFVGFIDKTLGTGSAAFQSFTFVCRGSSSGGAVFYWGDGMAVQPQESRSVKELLAQLSSHCK